MWLSTSTIRPLMELAQEWAEESRWEKRGQERGKMESRVKQQNMRRPRLLQLHQQTG